MSEDEVLIIEPLHNEDVEKLVVELLCRRGAMRKVDIHEWLQKQGYMVGCDRLSNILRGMVAKGVLATYREPKTKYVYYEALVCGEK